MLGEQSSRSRNKALRRRINQKVQTIMKKSAELTENSCQVLLIIHNTAKNHWFQFCSSEPSSLFFGIENAKKYLETVEEYNNNTIKNLVSKLSVDNDSCSPQPTKHLKSNESSSSLYQTINPAGKLENLTKISVSGQSTNLTSHKSFNAFSPKSFKPPDAVSLESKILKTTQIEKEDSSPDFSFDDYFGSGD